MLLASFLTILAGCGTSAEQSPAKVEASASKWPEKLVIAHNFPEEPKERLEREEKYKKLEDYLERTLKVDVVTQHSGSYTVTIEAMRAGKVDLSDLGAFSYVLARKLAAAEPLVIRGTKSNGPLMYHSVIVTRGDSEFKTLDEALAKADTLSFAFEFPTSTSGHLVPRGYLDSIGVNPEKTFKTVLTNAAYPNGVLGAIAGKVDLVCANTAALDYMQEKGVIKADQIRVLWESPPMPREPISIRGDLPDDFKQAVQDAYLNMHRDDPETFKLFSGSKEEDAVFLPGDDSLYDYYRQIARGIEGMNLLD